MACCVVSVVWLNYIVWVRGKNKKPNNIKKIQEVKHKKEKFHILIKDAFTQEITKMHKTSPLAAFGQNELLCSKYRYAKKCKKVV